MAVKSLQSIIFMRLSFVRLTLFLARLMARPRVTLPTSDTLSIVSSNVTTLIGRLACELRLARTTQESHDNHLSSGALEYFFLMAFHTLSLLHFPLPHFPLLHFPLPHFQRPRRSLSACFANCIRTRMSYSVRVTYVNVTRCSYM